MVKFRGILKKEESKDGKSESLEVEKPYTGPGDSSLPQAVQDLPQNLREVWVNVFNSAYRRCMEDGRRSASTCESSAFAQAWSVVNQNRSTEENNEDNE